VIFVFVQDIKESVLWMRLNSMIRCSNTWRGHAVYPDSENFHDF